MLERLFWKLFTIVFWLLVVAMNGWMIGMSLYLKEGISLSVSLFMLLLSICTFIDWVIQSRKWDRRD